MQTEELCLIEVIKAILYSSKGKGENIDLSDHIWVQCETNKLFSLFVIWIIISKSSTLSLFTHLFTMVCPWLAQEQKRRVYKVGRRRANMTHAHKLGNEFEKQPQQPILSCLAASLFLALLLYPATIGNVQNQRKSFGTDTSICTYHHQTFYVLVYVFKSNAEFLASCTKTYALVM